MASKRDGRARSGRKSESEMPVGSPPAQEESASRSGGPPVAPTPTATGNAESQPAASEIGPVAIQPRAEAAGGGPTEPSSPAAGGPAGPSSTRDFEPPTALAQAPNPSTDAPGKNPPSDALPYSSCPQQRRDSMWTRPLGEPRAAPAGRSSGNQGIFAPEKGLSIITSRRAPPSFPGSRRFGS